jgi:phosphate transport system protein
MSKIDMRGLRLTVRTANDVHAGSDEDARCIDGRHNSERSVLSPGACHGVASAVDVALLGRFYERFADHAVEIGRRVIFQATGETPDV